IRNVMLGRMPDVINLKRDHEQRKKKIYIDYLQNRTEQTTASVYSVRPVKGETVSTPLKWTEVNSKLDPKKFTIKTAPKRFEKVGDLWKDVLGERIDLQKAIKKFEKLINKE